jgi:N-acyl-phosphatidylethanolamine-hydrolysing phospholipase D
LDIDTVMKLNQKFAPKFFVGLGVEKLLQKKGITQVHSMDWWDAVAIGSGLIVNFVPAQHSSGRGLFDRDATLWGGFVVTGNKSKVYFAGDTGYSKKQFSDIYQRFGAMDIAILPVGAYEPREYMQHVHMNPHDAVLAHQVLKSKKSIPIHYGTFRLAVEKYDAPLRDLKAALKELGVPEIEFYSLGLGESVLAK